MHSVPKFGVLNPATVRVLIAHTLKRTGPGTLNLNLLTGRRTVHLGRDLLQF